MSRLILVDKPEGPTSHDIVATIRRTLGIKKVGHCGTLDPMASGLLLVLTGRATRLAEAFADHDKSYRGTVRFGAETDTDDRLGKKTTRLKDFTLDESALKTALAELAGRSSQVPPAYSAIKVGGVPLYKLARQGKLPEGELPSRPLRIENLELLELREGEADIEVVCGAGTYVRALARDIGRILEIPAHLSALRRTASGPFGLERAVDAERLLWDDSSDPLGLPLEEAFAHLPAARASEHYQQRLAFGSQPEEGDLQLLQPLPAIGRWVRLLGGEDELLALARVEADPAPVLRMRRSLAN